MIDLVKPINHPGHYGLGGFFLTAGGESGKIYMMPGAIVPLPTARVRTWPRATPSAIGAITTTAKLVCITAMHAIITPSGEDSSPLMIPPISTLKPSTV